MKQYWPNMNRLSDEEKTKLVNDFLQNTDWDDYWDNVTKACEPEIEAYRRASAASYAKAHEHWFI